MEIKTSIETQKKIKLMIIEDYKQQLEELKSNKQNYEYKLYRAKYLKLYNAILWHKIEYNKLLGE